MLAQERLGLEEMRGRFIDEYAQVCAQWGGGVGGLVWVGGQERRVAVRWCWAEGSPAFGTPGTCGSANNGRQACSEPRLPLLAEPHVQRAAHSRALLCDSLPLQVVADNVAAGIGPPPGRMVPAQAQQPSGGAP